MPFRATEELLDAAEKRIGRHLPALLRQRLLANNGGEVRAMGETWSLFPVWDPTDRKTMRKTASHIGRENEVLRQEWPDALPRGYVVVADNDAGDYLALAPDSDELFAWDHETRSAQAVNVDWSLTPPGRRHATSRDADRGTEVASPVRPQRRNHKKDAIERVERALRALADRTVSIVDIAAPETGIYIQFAWIAHRIQGEAVGETNLPKLYVFRSGAHLRDALPGLGWLPPASDGTTGGNWYRAWTTDEWNATDAARLVVATFTDAYTILPWALVATGRVTFSNAD